jgi:phosphate transport system substrate-binding protein
MRKLLVLAALAVLTLGAAACGSDDDGGSSSGSSDLSGKILIDGSSTVAPLSEPAAELFMEENPGVTITVGTSGTGGGFEKFCNGETDISDASRPIKDEEAELCKRDGIAFEQLSVANDAMTVVVNPDNAVDCLTVEQIAQVWAPKSKVSNWSEIDGLGNAPDAELDLYGPGTDSGTFDYFTDAINGEEGASRTDYNNVGEDDNATVRGVSGSEGGMGYFGYSFFTENEGELKALEIDGGDGCVAPSAETTQDGSYTPLGRQLFVYPSDKALARPEVKAFLEFYIENAASIAEQAGFIGLTEEQATEARDKIAELAD